MTADIEIPDGFISGSNDSHQLRLLKYDIGDLFISKIGESLPEKREMYNSTFQHTSRVALNVADLYQRLGQASDEIVYAAAICHDIGRLRSMPQNWALGRDKWIKYKDDHHAEFSGEECVPHLEKARYGKNAIELIRYVIVSHEDESVSANSPLQFRLIQAADKLDKLGKDGVNILFTNRRLIYPHWDDSKRLYDVEKVMKRTYEEVKRLGLVPEYIEAKYNEGNAEVQLLRENITKN
jgi:hypothetical protein